MQKFRRLFYRSTGLSPYVWVVLYILPFYFIFRSSSTIEVVSGTGMILLFFFCYVMTFVSKRGWPVFVWTGVQILVSIAMTLIFGYVYFALFLAFFIGNIHNRVGFITMYTIHLVTTIIAVNIGFATKDPIIISQLPFVLVCLIGVVLLPVNTYNKNRQDKLEEQLEDANKRISELVKLEERQRIARDLHDTLGQKLSLIGLKTDLAVKLIEKNPSRATAEMDDVRQTARSALNEVREMVTQMRGARVEDELLRVRQILKAAEIELVLEGDPALTDTSPMSENVLSMCLKEAVTNVVKHSQATHCHIWIEPSRTDLVLRVQDNGVGFLKQSVRGNGLRGMRERLEFVNGSLRIDSGPEIGTTVEIRVPNVPKQPLKEAEG